VNPPSVPTEDLRFSVPYNPSFEEAEKAGQAEEYFQSCNMDYECTDDIYTAVFGGKNHQAAAEEILTKYSKERAERVVAAIVDNAPADKFAEHKKWASQIRKNADSEPSARNIEIFQRHADKNNILEMFVKKFREIADSMSEALFPFIDNNGKQDWKSGWVLPNELTAQKARKQNLAKGLNIAQRMAVAEHKVNERESNRQTSTPHKPKKQNDPDLN